MKKIITLIAAIFATAFSNAQTSEIDFENFSLSQDSYYQDTTGADFITDAVKFQYSWDNGWSYWSGGFVYSNMTDSVTSGYGNMYSAKAGSGYNQSGNYLVGQNYAKVYPLVAPESQQVLGLYINNSTYAYNSMRDGDGFAKKFGGTTGDDPDWFKVVVRGYSLGVLINDSVEFYLADFRFSDNSQDYIIKDWSLVDVTSLGVVDSLEFDLSSSDIGIYGMNTPAFFCLDQMTILNAVGLKELNKPAVTVYPNPAKDVIHIKGNVLSFYITDITGRKITSGDNINDINISGFTNGLYVLHCNTGNQMLAYKFIKE